MFFFQGSTFELDIVDMVMNKKAKPTLYVMGNRMKIISEDMIALILAHYP